ncbi:protein-disulfide reductase DsbD family protein [Legionella quateirensis]|uniref:Thiol:disulfide interchange protein DsbD n=1 Tax=Legionella quateirensis TaxID=45072 RepID=A0A378KUP4_9GAMM|nr:protein-disulfide reductase DsbD domain-containing protein [Legionella quateirensis]KTD48355.1 thiol:disulfide interchange protein DsbD [Legionella quateirensis]STY18315.1 thiol:disulfide interchange protein DsbD [Legionella quateirensis]
MNRSLKIFWVLCVLFFGMLSCVASVYASKLPKANSSLISNTDSIREGHAVLLGVRLKLPKGWETFWRTPGEVGYGAKFSWEGSQNLEQAEVLWPWPTRIKSFDFIANVYLNEVIFPVKIIPKDATKTLALHLKLDYLLCSPTACVPQQAKLNLTLPPGDAAITPEAKLIDKAIKSIPKSGNTSDLALHDLIVTHQDDQTIDLQVNVWSAAGIKDAQLFVEGPDELLFNVPKLTQLDETHGFFIIQGKKNEAFESAQTLKTLLKKPLQLTLVNKQNAISLSKTVPNSPLLTKMDASNQTSQLATDPSDSYWIGTIVLFAFLGGLILNLMPCVFPILSLKILTLHSFKNKRMQGIFYTLGVMFFFFIIALITLLLQSLGNKVGWGFQMQSPAVLILLIFLFTLITMNLFGLFDIPFSLSTNLKWQKTHELLYAFGTGVLAAVVTTPCSAPFMATAVGVAISQGSWITVLIFLSLGFGFALPYLLLCTLPKNKIILPKPGVWMEKLKHFLGFPMLLSVIWLLWVAGLQMSYDSVIMLLVSLCFLALFFWLLRAIHHGAFRLIALLVSLALVVYPLYWIQQELTQKHQINEPYDYSSEQLKSLIKDHHKVFVYATAAWCITCKINEKIAIDTNEVQSFFSKEHIVVVKADWTNKNDAILQYLQQFNRAGVPLYVYYPQSGEPVVLPQILTPLTIINHIKQCR